MAESRGKREDGRLKEEFSNLHENGTDYVSHSLMRERLTSHQLKVKPKDANVAGLQLADLIAHPGYVSAGCYKRRQSLPDNFGGKIARVLEKSKYDRDGRGKIEGWGRKWLP